MLGAVEVVELSRDGEPGYDDFVGAHPSALLYHSLRFRDLLVDLLDCEPRYGVAMAAGQVEGVLPVMAAHGPYGTVLNSLPYFGSNGGVLATTPRARAALASWYDRCAAGNEVAAATVVANPLDTDPVVPVHQAGDIRVGCMTPLAGEGAPERRLTDLIDGSARRNVAKAVRAGVEVAVDNDAFPSLEAMHRAGMAAVSGRAKSPDFFAAVPRLFRAGEDYDLYVARIGDEVVAALLLFFYGSAVEYYVPATSPERRSEQPMAAILHRAMVDAAARGLRWWNWGGSWRSQENLIRFKTKWGGAPRTYRYWTTIGNPELLAAEPDQLATAYPGFFVVPYSSLRAATSIGAT